MVLKNKLKIFSRPPDHHIEISGGPTEVLEDWGHRTTLILSPAKDLYYSHESEPVLYRKKLVVPLGHML